MPRFGRRRADPTPRVPPGLEWFWEKHHDAAAQIAEFCEACAVPLRGKEIADLGCGEGSMALGLFRRAAPRLLVGFDIKEVDRDELLSHSKAVGVGNALPDGLEFRTSSPTVVPAADDSFDFVYSWSAFEHIADPRAVLDEIARVLRPDGHFFLQLWPFYFSGKGSHLWQWFDQDFHHLRSSEREVVASLENDNSQPREWTDYMSREFERLNRITVDQLQRVMVAAGFDVVRLELLTSPVMLTPDLARYAWADLAISGIKLLARPIGRGVPPP